MAKRVSVARSARPFRVFGGIFLSVAAFLMLQRSKPYYLTPAYPMLLAAGGVLVEQSCRRLGWPRLQPVALP